MISYLLGFSGRMNRLGWWLCTFLIPFGVMIIAAGIVTARMSSIAPDMEQIAGQLQYMSEAQAEAYVQSQMLMIQPQIEQALAPLMPPFWIALFIVNWIWLSATFRRFHDRDKSGAWFLVGLIPIIGGIWILVECGFLSGTEGANRFDVEPEIDEDNVNALNDRLVGRMEAAAREERHETAGYGQPVQPQETLRPADAMKAAFPNARRASFGLKA